MAELLGKAHVGTYEHLESARYLGESGDSQWFPVLAKTARQNPKMGNYLITAAQSGGEKALPLLMDLMRSPDKEFTRTNAVWAFGDTGSRAAIPILLDLLNSPDASTAQQALHGLQQLTHLSIEGDRWFENPAAQYPGGYAGGQNKVPAPVSTAARSHR